MQLYAIHSYAILHHYAKGERESVDERHEGKEEEAREGEASVKDGVMKGKEGDSRMQRGWRRRWTEEGYLLGGHRQTKGTRGSSRSSHKCMSSSGEAMVWWRWVWLMG